MEKTLDRWMGLEQEWAVPIKEIAGQRTGGPLYELPVRQSTYAKDLIYALSQFRFEDGSPPFLWFGRNVAQKNTHSRGLLRNGGFYEHQWDHIEITTPECRNHYELVKYDRANEIWMYLSLLQLRELYNVDINCWKANVDAKGVSRATHESYDCDRASYLNSQELLIPFFVFRQLFAGSGGFWQGRFVISPRAMVTDTVRSTSAGARCILHSYDEPLIVDEKFWIYGHGSATRFRCHQGFGDALRSEVACLLKLGVTNYMLWAVEENLLKELQLDDPLGAIKAISANTSGPWRVKVGMNTIDVVDYLSSDVLEAIEKVFANRVVREHDRLTLRLFKTVLEKFRQGLIEDLRGYVQWVMMKYFLDNYLDWYEAPSKEYTENEKRMAAALDFTNIAHDDTVWLDLVRGLMPDMDSPATLKPLKAETLFTPGEVTRAVLNPPPDSRGSLRIAVAQTFKLKEIDWHILSKLGEEGYRSLGGLDGWNRETIANKLRELQ